MKAANRDLRAFKMTTASASIPSEPQAKRAKTEVVTAAANQVITFHLLKRKDGQVVMEEDGHFQPEMSHQ